MSAYTDRVLLVAVDANGNAKPVKIDSLGNLTVVSGGVTSGSQVQLVDGNNTNQKLAIRADGSAEVFVTNQQGSQVSAGNFPTTLLLANETFIGPWEDVLEFAAIQVAIFTDQSSATNGASVEFSADGVNVVRAVTTTIPANTGSYFSLAPEARYVRFRYTNGSTPQTVLRGQIVYQLHTPAVVEQPLGAQLSDSNLAQIMRSALNVRNTNGTYSPLGLGGVRLPVDNQHAQALTDSQLRATAVPVSVPGGVVLNTGANYIGYVSQGITGKVGEGKAFSGAMTFTTAAIGISSLHAQFDNPINSGITATLRELKISSTSAILVQVFNYAASVASTAVAAYNRRIGSSGNATRKCTLKYITGNSTVLTDPIFAEVIPSGGGKDLSSEIITLLAANTSLSVWIQAIPANVTIALQMSWTED